MRMWMVEPSCMCRQHLLGEHCEIHMFLGTIKKGLNVSGYAQNNLLELNSLFCRHEKLVNEMVKRGYNHNTPLTQDDVLSLVKSNAHCDKVKDIRVNHFESEKVLLERCNRCAKMFEVNEWKKE